MNPLVTKSLAVADTQLGVTEVGRSNTGVMVDAYLDAVDVPPGNPWCAAFVGWVIQRAARLLGVGCKWPRTGYCPDLESWASNLGCLYNEPQAGDVFLLHGTVAGEYRACHTGFVVSVDGDTIHTIEGNTNLDGSREGYGVFARTRQDSSRLKYIRFGEVMGNDAPPAPKPKAVLVKGLVLPGVSGFLGSDGASWVPLRVVAEAAGATVAWDQDEQAPVLNGTAYPCRTYVAPDGICWANVHELAAALGLGVTGDGGVLRVG